MTTSVRLLVIALSAGSMTQMGTLQESPSAAGQPPCVAAANWVRTHRDALPRSYDAFAAYPVIWQRKIYAALSPEQQVSLWQAHLDRVVATVDLTPTQRLFLMSVRRDYARYFESDAATRQHVNARAEQILGEDLTRIAFENVGGLTKTAAALQVPDCSCADNSDCATFHVCRSIQACEPVFICGDGHDKCTGQCYAPE